VSRYHCYQITILLAECIFSALGVRIHSDYLILTSENYHVLYAMILVILYSRMVNNMFIVIKEIANLLIIKNWTLSTAESCTGGLISAAITDIAGSSQFFKGAIIAYDNSVKTELLNVKEETLINFGAVSSHTVEEMVKGACDLLSTDCALSASGVAGPGGGSLEKPVGLVYIGLKIKEKMWSFEHYFEGNRGQVRTCTVKSALLHLLYGISNYK
jgi:nicotinamide-nucleotide amidase